MINSLLKYKIVYFLIVFGLENQCQKANNYFSVFSILPILLSVIASDKSPTDRA